MKLFFLPLASFCLLAAPALAQKFTPNINESKEFKNVFHSPSADSTPPPFRSVLPMEIVLKRGDDDAQVIYADGTVVSEGGVIVTVIDKPNSCEEPNGGIVAASLLMLDGSGASADLVAYEAEYGLAIFRAKGIKLPVLRLSPAPIVANRRLDWYAVFRDGRKTFLYSRPLRVHKASFEVGGTDDLCQIIDLASSSLNADRSGSALLALDGTLVALMGRQEHWNVTPKNQQPRTKTAWGVPAAVIARLVEKVSN